MDNKYNVLTSFQKLTNALKAHMTVMLMPTVQTRQDLSSVNAWMGIATQAVPDTGNVKVTRLLS